MGTSTMAPAMMVATHQMVTTPVLEGDIIQVVEIIIRRHIIIIITGQVLVVTGIVGVLLLGGVEEGVVVVALLGGVIGIMTLIEGTIRMGKCTHTYIYVVSVVMVAEVSKDCQQV